MDKVGNCGGLGNSKATGLVRRNTGRVESYLAVNQPKCKIRENISTGHVVAHGSLEYFQTLMMADKDDGSVFYFHFFWLNKKGKGLPLPIYDINRHPGSHYKGKARAKITYQVTRVFVYIPGLRMPMPIDVRQIIG